MEAIRARSKDGKDSKEREENRSERLSSLSLARLCLLSSCNESRRPPRRRKLMIETGYTSPKAKTIAVKAVDFVSSPSCRAGTYFRYAAKVSKGAPKGKGKPFRAVSLFPLETLFPSAESRIASARQACGVLRLRKRQGNSRDAGQRPAANPRFAPDALTLSFLKLIPATLEYLN